MQIQYIDTVYRYRPRPEREEMMNKELMEALDILEKEKEISKETLFEAIENSLLTACKNHFGKADNVKVEIDRETCDFLVYAQKEVVETKDDVEDDCVQIALEDAQALSKKAQVGDVLNVEIKSKEFGRIATQNAKNVILQKIREEERRAIYDQYNGKSRDVVTGIVQRSNGKNITVDLDKCDAILTEKEQIKGENYRPSQRYKFYVTEVVNNQKGPKIMVSRTHPELVRRLFEAEVTEVKDGTVIINAIAREAGQRTKMAVSSTDLDVDPTGACVGVNGARVNAVVDELGGGAESREGHEEEHAHQRTGHRHPHDDVRRHRVGRQPGVVALADGLLARLACHARPPPWRTRR